MNLLSLEQAQKSYGEKVLLKQANFYLNEGEKVGIIGINGTGKTTLLRILAGTEVPDEGSRTVANHVVLRFLEQNPQMPADMSVLEYVLQGEKEEDRWILEPDAKTLLMTFEMILISHVVSFQAVKKNALRLLRRFFVQQIS